MISERLYQSELINEIKNMFLGCIVLKNDANYIQGFPDLTILYKDKWAVLEVKNSKNASLRPNQIYYLNECRNMGGFGEIIYPENETIVLDELRSYFSRQTTVRLRGSRDDISRTQGNT